VHLKDRCEVLLCLNLIIGDLKLLELGDRRGTGPSFESVPGKI
jgi:hypothetical protein